MGYWSFWEVQGLVQQIIGRLMLVDQKEGENQRGFGVGRLLEGSVWSSNMELAAWEPAAQ